jgi:transcription-repair coupling factor (superfamily II helicase)
MQAKSLEFLKDNKADNVITKDYKEALLVGEVAKYLNISYVILPDFRANLGDDMRSYKEELFELNSALFKYYNSNSLLISPINTVLRKLPTKKYFFSIKLEFADTINLNELKEKLVLYGYEVVSIIQEKGEVSFRGDIIDIYPINSDTPYRISLFDTEIENIRSFDEFTQISKDEVESIEIIPAIASLDNKEYEEINEKIEKAGFDVFYKDIYSLGFWFLEKQPIIKKFNLLYDMTGDIEDFKLFNEAFEFEINIIKEGKCKDFKPKNIKEFIELNPKKNIEILAKNEVLLKEKNINYPFTKSDVVLNVECPDKTIISLNEFKSKNKKTPTILIDDLKKGDFVVHEEHGIGKFMGLVRLQVLGKTGEFAEIRYANDDKLLLPIDNLNLIDRYIAPGGVTPSLDKMGKSTFSKNKQKVKEKIFAIAADIIKLSALRETITPKPMKFDGVEEFINEAGFSYTPDQRKAVEDLMKEMKTRVMDRLLSGDVGFGKTEIAMVASFIAVNSGYQVAMVAPTTILVSQHYDTFKKRFEKYNFKIAKVDRFTTTKEKKAIEIGLKEGEINIVLATHSAFNLEYKNLGLVVIDEEHKFGVKQKEKLKNMVKNVHLLSMSATPIPRSLNLALSKIKGFSALNTPPKNKQETRTFVKEYSNELIKEVILREIRRGGQVFYIYNNIAGIESKKDTLQKLIPNLRILVLHAKLTPAQIEKSMFDFINKKYDLIIATTIVESGIHIPNVNTVIVENADRFGIADLHQIRGRVGRGEKEGYAYFIVKDKEEISEDAKKRLLALEENSFLGSGAVLAMHDLEIRGGGNIIGEAQSGQIKNVGYSMYIKLLEDALRDLSGEVKDEKEVEIKLNINAYISEEVVNDERVRIEIYRRVSMVKALEELYNIEKELIDRFGKIDKATKNFLGKMKIKVLASKKGIKNISNYGENITIIYPNDKKFIKAKAKDDEIILETILEELR